MFIISASMDSEHSKNKGLVAGSDHGFESSIMGSSERSLDNGYHTTNLDMVIENLQKLEPQYQNINERDEIIGIGFGKNRDEYGVLEKNIRQFHIGIPTLKEVNETPQNMRIDILGKRLNSYEHIATS